MMHGPQTDSPGLHRPTPTELPQAEPSREHRTGSRQPLDCELTIASEGQARLSVGGREYSGRPDLGVELRRKLLGAELEVERYGTLLFRALFPGDGDELLLGFRESLAIAQRENRRLRLRLHLDSAAPQPLHELLWELLYDPQRRTALGRSPDTALSRYLSVAAEPGTAVIERPKLLVVTSCPRDLAEYGLPEIDRKSAEDSILGALAPLREAWQVESFSGPVTAGALRNALVSGGYHAVHLLAHGMVHRERRTASLALETSDGHTHLVDERLFAEIFVGDRNLRLITLTACESGVASSCDPFSGIGQMLVRGGLPAVVAMRRRIALTTATRFSKHFYLQLARGACIDTAINEARLQLHLAAPDSPEWSTPTLFMRLPGGRLWVAETPAPATVVGTSETPSSGLPTRSQLQPRSQTQIKTLLISELVDSTHLADSLGDERMAEIWRRHDRLARDLLQQHGGREAERTTSFLMLFERPLDAVRFALDFQSSLSTLSREIDVELAVRIGIHLGEVILLETPAEDVARGARAVEVEGLAKPVAARLMTLARAGQTILSQTAFDLARRSAVGSENLERKLRWVAHGDYLLKGVTSQVSVFEVGVDGLAPFSTPADTDQVRRAHGDRTILGWRPAIGLEVPHRRWWMVEKKLGDGGMSDVWLARHQKTHEARVFKFCFEIEHLKSLRREITLFRLLKETLGDRDDIARILDWNFDQAPYFIEAEYSAGGNLVEWLDERAQDQRVSLRERLEVVAQIGDALAAAHSVGVLHKDVKPVNVLIRENRRGEAQAILTDFGIGRVVDDFHLLASGITVLSLTELTLEPEPPGGGTRLYMAPEVTRGGASSIQADIYALGVLLYQLLVDDFTVSLAPGWERKIDDPLLVELVAWACDGNRERRLADGGRLARRLRTLEDRRVRAQQERQAREDAERNRKALEIARQRRKSSLRALAAVSLVAMGLGILTAMFFQQKERADRLTEIAVREKEKVEEAEANVSTAMAFLVQFFGRSDPQKTPVHSMTVAEFLEDASRWVEDDLELKPEVRAIIQQTLGRAFNNLGRYDRATRLLEQALVTQQQLLEPGNPDLIDTRTQLGIIAFERGEYEQAEEIFRSVLEDQEKALGPYHPTIGDHLNNLALPLEVLGRYKEVEQLYLRMRNIDRYHLPPDDPHLAAGASNLAAFYTERGEFENAERLHLEAIEIGEVALGTGHPTFANYLEGLGTLYLRAGRLEEALPLARRSLDIRRTALGAGHVDLAASYDLLARIYRDRAEEGDEARAEALFLDAHHLWRSSELGSDHTDVALSEAELADLYVRQGRPQEAVALYRHSVQVLLKSLGPEHPKTLDVARRLDELRLPAPTDGT